MADLPSGFPKSTSAQGALSELVQWLIAKQAIAIAGNSNLSRIIDSARHDTVTGVFTFSGAIPVVPQVDGAGNVEYVPVINF
jgi:hypothetical protein